ncbi:MAG: bacterial transcriptional activator domain-containing protein [Anaerolineae bacterium]|nr:bacterial transcriptional activator domain-containing protein [Anaerolineae bacterium]
MFSLPLHPPAEGIRITILSGPRRQQLQALQQLSAQVAALWLELRPGADAADDLARALAEPPAATPDCLIVFGADLLTRSERTTWLWQALRQRPALHILLVSSALSSCLPDDTLRPLTRLLPSDGPGPPLPLQPGRWLLEVTALGPGQVISEGQPVQDWRGSLTRRLFFFLLDKPIVSRRDLALAFWPGRDPRTLMSSFQVVRRKLEVVMGVDVVVYEREYYYLSPQMDVRYDVQQFYALLNLSRETADAAAKRQYLHQALALYRGDYLLNITGEWAARRRRECQQEYLAALLHLAQLWLAAAAPERALSLLTRLLHHEPRHSIATRLVMQIDLAHGRTVAACQALQRWRAAMPGVPLPPELAQVAALAGCDRNRDWPDL